MWQIQCDSKLIHQGNEGEITTAFEYMTKSVEELKSSYPDQTEDEINALFEKWKTPIKGEISLVQIHDKKYLS